MISVRVWHNYLGMLIAPSVLFFALTGALQLFGLHEAHDGYVPPAFIEKLGMLHKDQVFAPGDHHDPHESPEGDAKGAAGGGGDHDHDHDDDHASAPQFALKCYFLIVAIGLASSTLLGLWMGLTQVRQKRTGQILLGVGVLVPVLLVLLSGS